MAAQHCGRASQRHAPAGSGANPWCGLRIHGLCPQVLQAQGKQQAFMVVASMSVAAEAHGSEHPPGRDRVDPWAGGGQRHRPLAGEGKRQKNAILPQSGQWPADFR